MLGVRSDLPLRGDASGRFVVTLVAVLVFVAALAVTVNSYVGALLTSWDRSVMGSLTVQVPTANTRASDKDPSVALVVDVLSRQPAVAAVSVVPRERVVELLRPWLGDRSVISDLPLPALIDVELNNPGPAQIAVIGTAVKAAVPEAVIDDHRVWLGSVMGLAQGFGLLAVTITALVTGVLGLTVIFATRAGLTEFAQVIEVLHIVGARDGYVAGQFARRALLQTLAGSLAGLALYAPALGLVAWLASRIDPEILPAIQLPVSHWLGLALLPLFAGALAMVSANLTVRRALAARF